MIDIIPTDKDLNRLTSAAPWDADRAWAKEAASAAKDIAKDALATLIGEGKDLALTLIERQGLRQCSDALYHRLRAKRYRLAAERTKGGKRRRATRRKNRHDRKAKRLDDRCQTAPPFPVEISDGRVLWVRPCEVMQACEVTP